MTNADMTTKEDAPEQAVDHIAKLLLASNRIADHIARGQPDDNKLSLSDWLLLKHLAGQEGTRRARLASTLGVTRQRVQKQVEALATAGLVRVASMGEDRRGSEVTLTEAGQAALSRFEATVSAQLSAVPDAPTAERLGRLARSVNRLARGVRSQEASGPKAGGKAKAQAAAGTKAQGKTKTKAAG